MRRANVLFSLAGAFLLAANVAPGQAQAKLEFEVASVRPAADCGIGCLVSASGDPERIDYSHVSLRWLLETAFDMQADQVLGPDWLDSERFDVVAKVPPGTARAQVNEMLKNLLTDRFKIAYHLQSKSSDIYELTISKGGLKLLESAPASASAASGEPVRPLPVDPDGFPRIPPGARYAAKISRDGILRASGRMQSMSVLLFHFQELIGTGRIVDKTGLTGAYDIKLKCSVAGLPGYTAIRASMASARAAAADTASEPLPDLFTALEKQLGLKLEKKKGAIDNLVIDHAEKTPKEN